MRSSAAYELSAWRWSGRTRSRRQVELAADRLERPWLGDLFTDHEEVKGANVRVCLSSGWAGRIGGMVSSLRAFRFTPFSTALRKGNRDERYLPTPDPTQELSALTQNRGRNEVAWQRNRANSSLPFGVTYL